MDHRDHVALLRPADLPPGGRWADFGAGGGAFTLALRELVGPQADIYAVDKDRSRLAGLNQVYHERFGDTAHLYVIVGDFSRSLAAQGMPMLDGILMANSLHFFKDKETILRHVRTFLRPGGLLLLVEYNVDSGNFWVPHPLSFETFRLLAPRAGFSEPRLLAKRPSSFLRELYSAEAHNQPG
jgi:ubiquinone/menaquinone biosynthesis C-methylase UbiE